MDRGGGGGRSFDDGAKGVSVGWLFQLARFPWPPSRGSPSYEPYTYVPGITMASSATIR